MKVTLAVDFRLTDLDDAPIPDAPVRVAFGSQVGWQSADAGHRFTTDAAGRHAFTTEVTLDRRRRKVPASLWSTLVARPQWTDHLLVATELEYLSYPWLYVAEIHRFPDGDPLLLDGVAVYTRDAAGDFTIPARHTASGWLMAELGGARLASPGHEASSFVLQPDASDPARWTLRLAYRRWPAPAIR